MKNIEIRNTETGEYWSVVKWSDLRSIRRLRRKGMDARAATIEVLGQPTEVLGCSVALADW